VTGQKLTRLFVLGTVALVTIYDIVIYAASGVDATISRLLLRWASDLPILMLPIGILLGHWFWPQPRPKPPLEP
jgi:hypothetical protein